MIARAIAAIAALAGMPAVAQAPGFDPNNPEHQFRALAAYSASANACSKGDAMDQAVAGTLAYSMLDAGNAEAGVKVIAEVQRSAKATNCEDATLQTMLNAARPLVQPAADGYSQAFLDQGFCKASALAADVRVYSLVREAALTPARRTAAAAARKEMADHLKAACPQTSYQALGAAYNLMAEVAADLRQSYKAAPCRDSDYSSPKLFECVYGEDRSASFDIRDMKRFNRYQQRAAIGKATALELDAKKNCKAFSAAERVVGEAQMLVDAQGAVAFATGYTAPRVEDKEARYKTVEEALAAGRASAASLGCDEFKKPVGYGYDTEAPALRQGEPMTAATGLARTREATDRMAMLLATLPVCPALPNFAVSKKTAVEHVSKLPADRRFAIAASAGRQAEMLEEAGCTAEKLPKDFGSSPLAALDALKGKWK